MRKTRVITIDEDNRDKGRQYLLTEMPADQAEKWGMRALFLAAQSGADVVEGVRAGGLAGVATLGIQTLLGGLRFADAEPLLDEMFTCVQFCPDPAGRPGAPRSGPILPGEIEEVSTRWRIRRELLELHLGFSIDEQLSALRESQRTRDSSSPQTFPESSPQ